MEQAEDLVRRLSRYRLRSKVTLRLLDGWRVFVAWDGLPAAAAVAAPDPRLPDAGWRLLSPDTLTADATEDDWDAHRLSLGLPDGSRDLETEKSLLLEAGFDELNGVSWSKGCYMGQELTARTKYRGLIKRRIAPVAIDGVAPPPGTPILRDGAEVGTMRSARGTLGMAALRIEAIVAGDPLACGDATLRPRVPAWMRLPSAD
jgi:folate-binding protein YgfZ